MIKPFEKIKQNGIVVNMLLNTVAAAIPIVILQLVILPFVGKKVSADEYGLIVTLLALLNVVPATLGNALNNIRLLHRKEYEDNNCTGDYPILLLYEIVINAVVVILISVYYGKSLYSFNAIHYLLLVGVSILWLCREYFIVEYLLNLKYLSILINNIVLGIGYGIGTVLFLSFGYWELIYLIGYLFSMVYILLTTNIWKEKLIKTPLLKQTSKENVVYVIACLLYRLTSYADKMLLFPIIGGALVSVYYTATLSSKVISLLITPISSVMLAYLSRMGDKKGAKSFKQVLKIGSIICFIGYFACLLLSKPILKILYPQFYMDALRYIPITTVTIVINVLISLLNPFILRYLSMKWQLVINALTVVAYVGLSLLFFLIWGLMGFCVGCMLSSVLKIVSMLLIYKFASHRMDKVINE